MKANKVTFSLGEEVLRPFEYESFRVGPISVEIELQDGDTMKEAYERFKTAVGPVWDELFIFARDKFYEHHRNKG